MTSKFSRLISRKSVLVAAIALAFLAAGTFPTSAVADETIPLTKFTHDLSTGKQCGSMRISGFRSIRSDFSVEETVARLQAEITSRGLGIFGTIDHAAGAASVDLELRPTTLIIFGNPTLGTLLMQSNQTIGIDLPLKALVWEDECEVVRIGYNKAHTLARRHDITDKDKVIDNAENALRAIVSAAASDEE